MTTTNCYHCAVCGAEHGSMTYNPATHQVECVGCSK